MPRTDFDNFAVRVYPGELRFSAAHFITFDGMCENLHGHNFHVRIDVSGGNNADAIVVDFVQLNRVGAEICAELHDCILLPGDSNEMALVHDAGLLHVHSYDKHFSFPRGNCAILPLVNTTAELLAHYIGSRLREQLPAQALARARTLEVAVEEADQQWGICRWRLNDDR